MVNEAHRELVTPQVTAIAILGSPCRKIPRGGDLLRTQHASLDRYRIFVKNIAKLEGGQFLPTPGLRRNQMSIPVRGGECESTRPAPKADPERVAPHVSSVREVNYRGVSVLAAGARDPQANLACGFMEQLRYPLQSLDSAAQRRLARFPVLLFDFGFRDGGWWQSLRRHIPKAPEDAVWLGCIPRARVRSLARAILILGWHLARSDVEMARLLLGMSSPCAEVIAALSLEDIELLAFRQYRCVHPRWDHHPGIWRVLIEAARQEDPQAFSYVSAQGVQLAIADQLELN